MNITELWRNSRKTGAGSSAPPQGTRRCSFVWRRASAPFALFRNKSGEFQGIVPIRTTHTLHSRKAVEDALRREHARAERTGHPFCCVMFRLNRAEASKRLFEQMFKVLDRRCRSVDEIGWFGDDAICAILPDTNESGAQGFAADVVELAGEAGLFPSVTIYLYETATTPPKSGPQTGSRDLKSKPGANFDMAFEPSSALRWKRNIHLDFAILGMESLFLAPAPFWKRAIDCTGAGLALLLFSPLMAVIALLIKYSEPKGSIFFKQQRAGLGGRPFTMIKFRSMSMDAEARKEELRAISEQDGPAFKMKADPRVTPLGRFLRKTSLDELLQLFNVLSGDMSLVGPRPPTLDEVPSTNLVPS
jgi:hypothetical protein